MKYLNCALMILAAVLLANAACAFPAGDSVENPKKGILVVAFGSSMPEGEASIEAVTDAVRKAYPDVETRVAYTSRIIMRKIARECGKAVDEPAVALAKMAYEGFTDVAVLSTHIIPGEEYDDLKAVVDGFKTISANAPKAGFRFIGLSSPLLSGAEDFERLAGVLADTYSAQTKGGAFVFVGHGTHHFANAAYGSLQFALWGKSPNFYVGTIEGLPSYDDVASGLRTAGVKNVWIAPAMLVAGDHAHNDIAGDESDSWKSMLEAQGYKVTPVLEGLGQNAAVRGLILAKLGEVWDGFNR
jgi:sirohydrochlorin cobaltochelatase